MITKKKDAASGSTGIEGHEDINIPWLMKRTKEVVEEALETHRKGMWLGIVFAIISSIVYIAIGFYIILAVMVFVLFYLYLVDNNPKVNWPHTKAKKSYIDLLEMERYFKEMESESANTGPQVGLERIMLILGSMEEWQYFLFQRRTSMMIWFPLILTMLVAFAPMGVGLQVIIMAISLVLMFSLIGWSKYRYNKEIDYWRPRLATFKGRLEGFWDSLPDGEVR